MSDANIFAEEQQAALLGHAFQTPEIWATLDQFGITKEWFDDTRVRTLFEEVTKFRTSEKRAPLGGAEVIARIHEEPKQKRALEAAAERCITESKKHGYDVLQRSLVEWAKSRIVVNRVNELVQKHNDGKRAEAIDLYQQGFREIAMLEVSSGTVDTVETAPDQLKRLHAADQQPLVEPIMYNIPFLDDLTGGMVQNDLHILTAYTGVGKTELAKEVGVSNAMKGKRVVMFALEAAPQEIENRHRFKLFYQLYHRDHPSMLPGTVNYVDFTRGNLRGAYKPYQDQITEIFEGHLKTFRSYYRKARDFTVKTLESKLLEVHKEADLVILDHIHYVDTEGRDENREMHDIIKKVRDLSIHLGTPMLVLAHLRKLQGAGRRERALLPDTNEIQGSGAISKMATAVITFGRTDEITATDPRASGHPTLMRATKFRDDGSRTMFTGVSFFQNTTRSYAPDYALGKLSAGDTKWTGVTSDRPYWARHANITDLGGLE
jgi:replicative DNA helicase